MPLPVYVPCQLDTQANGLCLLLLSPEGPLHGEAWKQASARSPPAPAPGADAPLQQPAQGLGAARTGRSIARPPRSSPGHWDVGPGARHAQVGHCILLTRSLP